MKIYEAWEELKTELEKFIDTGDGYLIGGDDSHEDDNMIREVLSLIEYLEMKHE